MEIKKNITPTLKYKYKKEIMSYFIFLSPARTTVLALMNTSINCSYSLVDWILFLQIKIHKKMCNNLPIQHVVLMNIYII